jgi:hypothetical protein
VVGADLGEDRAHGLDLPVGVATGGVDHVDEQVGLADDLERRAERLDELVGQLAHEADGVGEQHGLATGQVEAPDARVEGGEEPVLDEHAGVGQAVQQRRLAGVGVPDDRDGPVAGPGTALGLGAAGPGQGLEVGLEAAHAAEEAAPVDLELGLARGPRTRSAPAPRPPHGPGLAGEGDAPAPQPGQAVAQLRQLDLGPALGGAGVLGEDVEDHLGAADGGRPRIRSRLRCWAATGRRRRRRCRSRPRG